MSFVDKVRTRSRTLGVSGKDAARVGIGDKSTENDGQVSTSVKANLRMPARRSRTPASRPSVDSARHASDDRVECSLRLERVHRELDHAVRRLSRPGRCSTG